MSRRMALPGADELFRSTGHLSAAPEQAPPPVQLAPATEPADVEPERVPRDDGRRSDDRISGDRRPDDRHSGDRHSGDRRPDDRLSGAAPASAPARVRTTVRRRARSTADRQPTGRERHEEKITVYVSPEELLDLEQARLTLRGDHGLAVDRGRIVREALAVVLADLDAKGESSILVRRLHGR